MDHALCSKAMVLFLQFCAGRYLPGQSSSLVIKPYFQPIKAVPFFMPKICFTLDFDIESGRMNMTN
jgi:hypothetical protein